MDADDRAILEIREMLAKLRNKDAVVRLLVNRGTPPDEARELVYSIHKANLTANRKHSFYGALASGPIFALLLIIVIASHRIRGGIIIGLVITGGAFLWSAVSLCMASGYEVTDD